MKNNKKNKKKYKKQQYHKIRVSIATYFAFFWKCGSLVVKIKRTHFLYLCRYTSQSLDIHVRQIFRSIYMASELNTKKYLYKRVNGFRLLLITFSWQQ